MFAKVELTKELNDFINQCKNHNESFEEIKELIFTSEMLKRNYSFVDQLNIKMQFQEMKNNTFFKVLNNKELNYIEGMLLERLIDKHDNIELKSLEEHLKEIEMCCEYVPAKSKAAKMFACISERFGSWMINSKY